MSDEDKEAQWKASARAARLHYVSDDTKGITREPLREGFQYRDRKGQIITDEAEIDRIRKLAIPPAYKDVWICPDPIGHLQASRRGPPGRQP